MRHEKNCSTDTYKYVSLSILMSQSSNDKIDPLSYFNKFHINSKEISKQMIR